MIKGYGGSKKEEGDGVAEGGLKKGWGKGLRAFTFMIKS